MATKKKMSPTTIVCAVCGSDNVETRMWVNPNTYEVTVWCSNGDDGDNWCANCQEHTNQITVKEFKQLPKQMDHLESLRRGKSKY